MDNHGSGADATPTAEIPVILTLCPTCAARVPAGARFCGTCGTQMTPPKRADSAATSHATGGQRQDPQLPREGVGEASVSLRYNPLFRWALVGIVGVVFVLTFVACIQGGRADTDADAEGQETSSSYSAGRSELHNDNDSSSNEAACDSAMSAAAAVPLSQTNDAEFAVTLQACESVSDWSDAFVRYPNAAGLTRASAADVPIYLSVACGLVPTSPVCREAYSSGYIG